MKNSKERLFEIFEKTDSTFKPKVEEVMTTPTSTPMDVQNLQKATQKSPTMQYANAKIDTPQEFQQGFATWLSGTGFYLKKKPLSISQAQTLVKNAMLGLGFK